MSPHFLLFKKTDIHIKFSHERGGSMGCGDQALNRSISSQARQTLTNGIKITEQGEVLASRYLLTDIARIID